MNANTLLTQLIIGLAIASGTEVALHYSLSTTSLYLAYWALAFIIITPILFLAVGYLHSLSEQVNTSGVSRVQYQLFELLQNCYDHGLIVLTLPLGCLLLTFSSVPVSPVFMHGFLGTLGAIVVVFSLTYYFVFKGKVARFTSMTWLLLPLIPVACLVLALAAPTAAGSMIALSLVAASLGISTEAAILILIDLFALLDLTTDLSRTGYQNENLA